MRKFIKLPVLLNKKNGQINSYFKKEQLPKSVRDAIKQQPKSVKKLIMKYERFE